MSFIYYCPHCSRELDCPDEMENTNCNCPACGKTITPKCFTSSGYPSKARKRDRQYEKPIWVLLFESLALCIFVVSVFASFYCAMAKTSALALAVLFCGLGGAVSLWLISLFGNLLAKNNFYLQCIIDRLEK